LARTIQDEVVLGKSGVLKIEGEKVLEVVEKPKKGMEPSNLGVIGIYLLNKKFIEVLKTIPKEHYSFEKSFVQYSKKGTIGFAVTSIENVSLKYPWDVLDLKNHLFMNLRYKVDSKAEVAQSAQLIGDVYVDSGAKIMENATVKGPCYIGKNTYVGNNSILRSGVDIEEGSVVGAGMEMKNTLMMESSKVHSGFVGDSVIGKNCRIGAGITTANVRLDRGTVRVNVKGIDTLSGLKSLGVMIGEGTHIGIKASTMPGVIIGNNVTIGSNTSVMNNVPDNSKYYTKFEEVILKNDK
jgi:bifunctional UDP-N-acetylglucosamine pyrophosphorylase/glucosamine-1-phosphate N-acetyltransferase